MPTLLERPPTKISPAELRIAPAQAAPRHPGRAGRNAGHRTLRLALATGKRALLKIAGGIAGFGSILSGPPMSERDRSRYAAAASRAQTQKALAAVWSQYPLRGAP